MLDDKEWILGLVLYTFMLFLFGFGVGSFRDEYIKTDFLARALYKSTNDYLQHNHDNFYDLLKLVEIKEQQ